MAATAGAHSGSVAVIGAGIAGMTCAAALAEAGLAVEIFEKSSTIGGRLCHRPVGNTTVDIGAQYATARGPAFRAHIDRMAEAGGAARWQPEIRDIRLDDDGVIERRDPWFVGHPGMGALAHPQTMAPRIHFGSRVTGIIQGPGGWALTRATEDAAGPFSAVAITAPAPQTQALTAGLDPVFDALGDVGMSPCWTHACVFEQPIAIHADVVRPSRNAITWAARNCAKPGRNGAVEAWVIHGDPVWSLDHLEESPDFVARALQNALAQAVGVELPPAIATKSHRWRFARVEAPVGESHLLGCDGTLGVAGDWCIGARVEAAFDSGRALGQAMAARLRAPHPQID